MSCRARAREEAKVILAHFATMSCRARAREVTN